MGPAGGEDGQVEDRALDADATPPPTGPVGRGESAENMFRLEAVLSETDGDSGVLVWPSRKSIPPEVLALVLDDGGIGALATPLKTGDGSVVTKSAVNER